MKKLSLLAMTGVLGLAAIGCSTTANTNAKVNGMNVNANTAVVVNSSNTNMMMNANMGAMNPNRYGTNMSRADYEKNEAEYKTDQAASTIGQGADDKWIWFKTKTALAGVNDLRDSTINVDVTNAVITLKGTVGTAAQKTAAVAAAKGIDGQKGIKDELKVQPNDSLTNQTVTTGNSSSDGMKGNMNHK